VNACNQALDIPPETMSELGCQLASVGDSTCLCGIKAKQPISSSLNYSDGMTGLLNFRCQLATIL
jgi:hypothetical protein